MAHEIQVGNKDAVSQILKNKPRLMLTTRYMIPMMFTENVSRNLVRYSLPKNSNSTFEAHICLELTALHLAIISNQSTIVSAVLNHLQSRTNNHYIIKDVFVAKTKSVFAEVTRSKIQDFIFGTMVQMDGMNCLHLAAKYSAESLYKLLHFVSTKEVISSTQYLLDEKDGRAQNTALHIAASLPNASVIR